MPADRGAPTELDASGGPAQTLQAAPWGLALLEATTEPILVVGPDRRVVVANHEAERIFGHDAGAFVERPIEDLVQASDRRACLHLFAQHLETATAEPVRAGSHAFNCRLADGSELPATWTLTPFQHDGQAYVVATIQTGPVDTRDPGQDGGEAALEQAHEHIKYQATLLESQNEASIDGILIVDNESRIVSYNRRFLEIWGLDDGLVRIGDTDEEALEDALDQIENVGAFLERVEWLHDNPEATLRDEVDLVDGRVLERWTTPVKSDDGTLYGRGWYFRDITDRKRVEEELRRHREELEALVAERTTDLTETTEQLRREVEQRTQAEAELERRVLELARSNEELERFAYVASHDLQEPLRMVASYVQLLARRYEGQLDPEADEYIAYAVEGATRMQILIRDVLTYSQLGNEPAETEPVDLEAVLEAVLMDLEPTLEDSGATVTTDPLPTVPGSRSELYQVLENLLSNAVKFHGDDPPEVHISARRLEDAWEISVSDNGVGIDPEYQDRIFQMFQRLYDRASYPGTGIGLAICEKVVEAHGGRIWVEPAPNGGSIFRFTLPDEPRKG